MHGLQAAVSKRCPSNSEHVALTSRTIPSLISICTAIRPCRPQRHVKWTSNTNMSGHVTTEDYNNMATIISQGGCDAATTSSPAPLVILSRFFLPFHLSWPPNIGQSCRICSWWLMPSCSLQLCGGSIQHDVYRWLSWQLSGSDVVFIHRVVSPSRRRSGTLLS